MSFDWFHRRPDRWQLCACDAHGVELGALGFQRGVNRAADVDELGVAHQCALCNGTTSIAELRACCCHVGTVCPVHRRVAVADDDLAADDLDTLQLH